MVLDNVLILFTPWAGALLTSRASFEPSHIVRKFGFSTLIGALAASVAGVPRNDDLGRRVNFLFENTYLSGVLLLFVTATGICTYIYYMIYEAWKQASTNQMKISRLYTLLMAISLGAGYTAFCAAIIVPQNL
jgi:hypothetical protein